ncbi:differentially expressed in FDCP 8 homolog isoform X1 [Onthophagus taurus]|uniref:differentially expressed in FDCP 8 homolog isoform X1 n=1 Tax=Onthophagus taurus TaxID=166361 RepID=UPI000C209F43|nr:differentially expressed in FDCP 8 homolog isoform X2 [Onthophagus taurus]
MSDESRCGLSTPTSCFSTCPSIETGSEDQLPPALVTEELQLALNKEATESELKKAVERCKELVLNCEQCSVERRWLVRHLIELRLRLQECREALVDPNHPRNKSSGVSRRVIRGHHLNLQPLLRSSQSKYCDHCTGIIWSVVQAWYECEDCGFSCHHKCLSSIVRDCAHIIASERGGYELRICPETGMSAQKYLCAECKTPLAVSMGMDIRRCDYNGMYYCSACHWGSLAVTPARVVHNWDMTPHPVCQASLQQLKVTLNRPYIDLEKENPKLFTLVHELNLVKRCRQELHGMRKYLLICRIAKEDHLLWKCVEIPHLIETVNLYSLQDLVNTESGELITKLHNLYQIFSNHIKKDCQICKGRGHICEICSNTEELFPFDAIAVLCPDCGAVYHKNCFSRKNNVCLKCIRIKERLKKAEISNDDD